MKTKSKTGMSVLLKLALLGVAAAGALLSSGCTYNQVMQERTAENNYLRGQLADEEARGRNLSY